MHNKPDIASVNDTIKCNCSKNTDQESLILEEYKKYKVKLNFYFKKSKIEQFFFKNLVKILKKDLSQCQIAKDEYFLENVSLHESVDSLKCRLIKKEEELRQLVAYDEETYQQNSNMLDSYQSKFSDLEKINKSLNNEISAQKIRLDQLINDLQIEKNKVNESNNLICQLKEEKNNLIIECKAKNESISLIKSLNDNINNKLGSMLSQLNSLSQNQIKLDENNFHEETIAEFKKKRI